MINERYARQVMLEQMGKQGQEKLASTSVLIVGVGGLGSVISTYLCGAGVGHIGVIDGDEVSISNLQRQVLYEESQVGLPKASCAKERLSRLNSTIAITAYDEMLCHANASRIISEYDMVVDGCDNFDTRYLISDTCAAVKKPYIFGAISEFAGQVAVLCARNGKTLRDMFGQQAMTGKASSGVLGVTPGIVGAVEANQVLQLACGFGTPLVNKMWIADFLTMHTCIIDL